MGESALSDVAPSNIYTIPSGKYAVCTIEIHGKYVNFLIFFNGLILMDIKQMLFMLTKLDCSYLNILIFTVKLKHIQSDILPVITHKIKFVLDYGVTPSFRIFFRKDGE